MPSSKYEVYEETIVLIEDICSHHSQSLDSDHCALAEDSQESIVWHCHSVDIKVFTSCRASLTGPEGSIIPKLLRSSGVGSGISRM